MTTSFDEVTSVHGIPLPLELGKTPRLRVVNYEANSPGAGVSASYVNAVYSVTLYVYDLGLSNLPEDPLSSSVMEHFQESVQGALTSADSNGERLECKAAHGVSLEPDSGVNYLVATFGLENDQGRFRSFIFLTTKNGRFVKLRMSFHPTSLAAESLSSIVARTYFALLWPDRSIDPDLSAHAG